LEDWVSKKGIDSGGHNHETYDVYVPASDGEVGSGSGVGASGGERGVGDAAALDGLRELPDGDVVVQAGAGVRGVDDDVGDTSLNTGGRPGLTEWLDVTLWRRLGCRTHQSAGNNGDGAGGGAGGAVGGSDDGGGVQERTAAEVGAALLEGDDVGEVTGSGGLTADNELVELLGRRSSGLGEGSDHGDGGSQGDGAGERSHCDDVCFAEKSWRLDFEEEEEEKKKSVWWADDVPSIR
jgi:hypothetical protein